jgi:hypothetical protein
LLIKTTTNLLSLGGVSTSYKAATPEIQIINKIKTTVDFCPLAALVRPIKSYYT